MGLLHDLCMAMIAYDAGDPKRIQHFMKVHAFAGLIAKGEGLDAHTVFVLEAAAYVHDIGIHEGERLYGRNDGKTQEMLGPAEARPMLEKLGFSVEDTERICFLVGHHHSYGKIDGPDFRILVEADMIVNAYEDGNDRQRNEGLYKNLFVTDTGRDIFRKLFLEDYAAEPFHA